MNPALEEVREALAVLPDDAAHALDPGPGAGSPPAAPSILSRGLAPEDFPPSPPETIRSLLDRALAPVSGPEPFAPLPLPQAPPPEPVTPAEVSAAAPSIKPYLDPVPPPVSAGPPAAALSAEELKYLEKLAGGRAEGADLLKRLQEQGAVAGPEASAAAPSIRPDAAAGPLPDTSLLRRLAGHEPFAPPPLPEPPAVGVPAPQSPGAAPAIAGPVPGLPAAPPAGPQPTPFTLPLPEPPATAPGPGEGAGLNPVPAPGPAPGFEPPPFARPVLGAEGPPPAPAPAAAAPGPGETAPPWWDPFLGEVVGAEPEMSTPPWWDPLLGEVVEPGAATRRPAAPAEAAPAPAALGAGHLAEAAALAREAEGAEETPGPAEVPGRERTGRPVRRGGFGEAALSPFGGLAAEFWGNLLGSPGGGGFGAGGGGESGGGGGSMVALLERIATSLDRLIDIVQAGGGNGFPGVNRGGQDFGGWDQPVYDDEDDGYTPSSPSVHLDHLERPGKSRDASARPRKADRRSYHEEEGHP